MSATLSPALVRAILRTAKVDPFDFLRAFEESNAPEPTRTEPSAPLLRGHGRAWEASTTSDDDDDQGPISRVA